MTMTTSTGTTERLLSDILARHPNELALSLSTHGTSTLPNSFDSWWSWASDSKNSWQSILHGTVHDLPIELRQLLDYIQEHSLDRTPIPLSLPPPNARVIGLSPKKSHEVHRMTSYISSMLPSSTDVWIVDVGSGQGYLTRSLLAHLNPERILALDRNPLQTSGAQTWSSKQGNKKQSTLNMDRIEYRTMDINQHNLLDTVDEWVALHGGQDVKVLFVALHACGSLTLDIVRAFAQRDRGGKGWKPMGVVVVGCCYNLLRPSDYPLCSATRPRALPPSAYHLASQVPSTWTDAHTLSMQKLVWRALLGPLIPDSASTKPIIATPPVVHEPTISHTENTELGMTPTNIILGKLPKSAYTSWSSFLLSAFTKLQLPMPSVTEKSEHLENQLAVLNLLRCLAGPYVESLLLRDRLAYIQGLVERDRWRVDMVPLFDQAEASARNMSISIFPSQY